LVKHRSSLAENFSGQNFAVEQQKPASDGHRSPVSCLESLVTTPRIATSAIDFHRKTSSSTIRILLNGENYAHKKPPGGSTVAKTHSMMARGGHDHTAGTESFAW
jgi:hypothetical protein